MADADEEEFFKEKSENAPFFGVYPDFGDMPEFGEAYDSEANLESTEATRQWLSLIDEERFSPPVPYLHIANVFSLAVSTLRGGEDKMNILEFGGRSGLACVSLLQTVPWAKENVNYFLLERSTFTRKLREEDNFAKADYPNVQYISELGELPNDLKLDCVLISSHLQYIENYKRALDDILMLKPKRLLFSHVAICRSAETFATYQVRFVPSPMRRWIFSHAELLDIITSGACYELTYLADCYEDKLTFTEFPDAYRDCTYAHLLFSRRD